jgi:hypothetical protein
VCHYWKLLPQFPLWISTHMDTNLRMVDNGQNVLAYENLASTAPKLFPSNSTEKLINAEATEMTSS